MPHLRLGVKQEVWESLNNRPPRLDGFSPPVPPRLLLCPTFLWLPPLKAAKGNNGCQPQPSCVFLRCSWIINYGVSVSEVPWLPSTCFPNIKAYRSGGCPALLQVPLTSLLLDPGPSPAWPLLSIFPGDVEKEWPLFPLQKGPVGKEEKYRQRC